MLGYEIEIAELEAKLKLSIQTRESLLKKSLELVGERDQTISHLREELAALPSKTSTERELLGRLEIMEGNWNREKTVSAEAQQKVFAVTTDLQNAWEHIERLKGVLVEVRDEKEELLVERAGGHFSPDLDAQINELLENLSRRDELLERREGRITDLERMLKVKGKHMTEAQRNRTEEAVNKITDLESRLEEAEAVISDGLPRYQAKVERLQEELEERDTVISSLAEHVEAARDARARALEDKVEGLEEELEIREEVLVELQAKQLAGSPLALVVGPFISIELNRLKGRLTQRDERILFLDELILERDNEIKRLDSHISQLADTLVERDNDIKALRGSLEERTGANAVQINSMIDAMQNGQKVLKLQAMVKKLQGMIEERDTRISYLKRARELAREHDNKKLSQSEGLVKKLQAHIRDLDAGAGRSNCSTAKTELPDEQILIQQGMIEARDQRLDEVTKQAAEDRAEANAKIRSLRAYSDRLEGTCKERQAEIIRLTLAENVNAGVEPEIPLETTYVLDRAGRLICSERAVEYGLPGDSFKAIAELWTTYLRAPIGALDARDVGQMLILFKSIRDRVHRKIDNLDDIAGYAQCLGWVGDPRKGKPLDEVLARAEEEASPMVEVSAFASPKWTLRGIVQPPVSAHMEEIAAKAEEYLAKQKLGALGSYTRAYPDNAAPSEDEEPRRVVEFSKADFLATLEEDEEPPEGVCDQ